MGMKCIDMHHAIRMARMQRRPSSCNSVLFFLSEMNLSKLALFSKVKRSLFRKEFAETSLIEFMRPIFESSRDF